MSFNKFPEYVALIISCLLVIAHVFEVLTTNVANSNEGFTTRYQMVDEVKYGALALVVVIVLIATKKEAWKLVFGSVLILSFTPVVKFSSYTLFFETGLLYIDLISLTLLIGHISMNKEAFNFLKPSGATKKGQLDKFEAGIKNFMHRFRTKSQEELEQISVDANMSQEAVEAAKRLLKNSRNQGSEDLNL